MSMFKYNEQIKSKNRVSEYGEVFTTDKEVRAMCDLVGHECERIDSRFLEPACGNGNFLVEILRRKLITVGRLYGENISAYRLHMIEAVASIYGVDIQADNVEESRQRLIAVCREHFLGSYDLEPSEGLLKALRCVLKRNIICGNTLTGLAANGASLVFSEWKLTDTGMFERRDFLFSDILENKDSSIHKKAKVYDWRLAA